MSGPPILNTSFHRRNTTLCSRYFQYFTNFLLRWYRWCYAPKQRHSNAIRTSKYTVLTFLPKSLFYQFSRFSNIYFFLIGLLQLFPVVSDSRGVPTCWLPLGIVIFVSSLKDLIEDLRRHRSDAEENNRLTKVCVNGEVIIRHWSEIRIGDIVKIERNDHVPADLILLGTSGDFGVCYVETKSLDGETNLKHKVALPDINRLFTNDDEASRSKVVVNCGPPSDTLYEFSGTLLSVRRYKALDDGNIMQPDCSQDTTPHDSNFKISNKSCCHTEASGRHSVDSSMREIHETSGKPRSAESTSIRTGRSSILHCSSTPSVPPDELEVLSGNYPLNLGQFLLRGTSLVNTSWVYGLVVYVSTDTRIFQNANTKATFKWSHLEKTYNRHVLVLVAFEFTFCLIVCIGAVLFPRIQWYIDWPLHAEHSRSGAISTNETTSLNLKQRVGLVFTVLGQMFILFVHFVPIDIFLALEIVRFVQATFVTWDSDLQPKNGGIAPTSQGAHLLEELGNTTHVFTDKTGTLTNNLMILRALGFPNILLGTDASGFPLLLESKKAFSLIKDEGLLDSGGPAKMSVSKIHPEALFADQNETKYPEKDCDLINHNISSESELNAIKENVSVAPAHDSSARLPKEQKKHPDEEISTWTATCTHPGKTLRFPNLESVDIPKLNIVNEFCSLTSEHLEEAVAKAATDETSNQIRSLLLGLATCHTVLVRHLPTTLSQPSLPYELREANITALVIQISKSPISLCWDVVYPPLTQFDASSPDELSLVSAAQSFGVEFFCRTQLDKIKVRLLTPIGRRLILGSRLDSRWKKWISSEAPPASEFFVKPSDQTLNKQHTSVDEDVKKGVTANGVNKYSIEKFIWVPIVEIDLLDVLEFDNDRKRMSVIIRDVWSEHSNEGVVRLLTKGADSAIVDTPSCSGDDQSASTAFEQITLMAHRGLRTLAFGDRVIPKDVFQKFHEQLLRIRASVVDHHSNSKAPVILRLLIDGLERNLRVIGCSGVEDRLQDEVSDVIEELRTCDIKLWLLTGDKVETAINIGYSTRLLTSSTYNGIIDGTDRNTLDSQISTIREFCELQQLLRKRQKDSVDRELCHPQRTQVKTSSENERIMTERFGDCNNNHKLNRKCCGNLICNSGVPRSSTFVMKDFSKIRKNSEEYLQTYVEENSELIFADCLREDSGCSIPKSVATQNFDMNDLPTRRLSRDEQSPTNSSYGRLYPISHEHSNDKECGSCPRSSAQSLDEKKEKSDFTKLPEEMKLGKFRSSCEAKLQTSLEAMRSCSKCVTRLPYPNDEEHFTEFSITVTGAALDVILKRRNLLVSFYRLTRHAAVVIACRVTPKQKSLLVKQSTALNPTCCSSVAIGDGANDVAMILSASVGIGISGKEGLQATRAADFSIAEFRFLRKLLLVHGRESLRRNSFLVYFGIFKNISLCVASFVYQFYCGFSGQDIYNFWLKSLYGTVFVAPTAILYAILDRELPHYILHRSPITYRCLAPVMWPVEGSMWLKTSLHYLQQYLHSLCCQCFCCDWKRKISPAKVIKKRDASKNKSPKNQKANKKSKVFRCCGRLGKVQTKLLKAVQYSTIPRKQIRALIMSCRNRCRSVSAGVRCYGFRLLSIWLFYSVFVAVVITILPLEVLRDAASIDSTTLRTRTRTAQFPYNSDSTLNKTLSIEYKDGATRYNDAAFSFYRLMSATLPIEQNEDKTGFDLPSVGMVVVLQCIVVSNLVVLCAVNSLFLFQAIFMACIVGLFFILWSMTVWSWLVTKALPGLYALRGTFGMLHKSNAYYFCVFLSTFICTIPLFSARAFKIIFEPFEVTIIKERMLQGVFDVVIGRRHRGRGELVVFVPQPHAVDKEGTIMAINSPSTVHSVTELDRHRIQRVDNSYESLNVNQSHSSHPHLVSTLNERETTPTRNVYRGFAFGYEDTVISSPPSVWILASLAQWAGRQVGPPLYQMGTKLLEVSTGFLSTQKGYVTPAVNQQNDLKADAEGCENSDK